MGFIKGVRPPKAGESMQDVIKEQENVPELDDMINKMKEVSEDKLKEVKELPPEPFKINLSIEQGEPVDGELQDIKQEVKKSDKYLDIKEDKINVDDLLKIPANDRTPEQHSLLLSELGSGIYLKMLEDEKPSEKQISKPEPISTTYKGIKGLKRITTEVFIGSELVRREIEEKEIKFDLTTD